MSTRTFLVDVEAAGPSPATGVLTEFGIVGLETRAWFHGRLWDAHPDPDNPAKPVPVEERCEIAYTVVGRDDEVTRRVFTSHQRRRVFDAAGEWALQMSGQARPVFVSDNPAYDFMWLRCGFDDAGADWPFGHSARRIGDFAAGLDGKWTRQSHWKRLRRTRHDHNPVNDAMGNAEALAELLSRATRRHDGGRS